MAASAFLSDATLNWLRGSAYPAEPAALYVSIHADDPGEVGLYGDVTTAVIGGRVQLQQADLGAPGASPGGGRQISNTAVLTLSNSALSSTTLTHFGIWTASTAGNFLLGGKLTTPVPVLVGDILRFAAGQLIIPIR